MRATPRACVRCLLAFLLLAALPVAGAGKSVLLLQQDDDAWPAYQAFYAGFRDALARDYGADLVIYRENLDLSRFPDAAYRDALRRWYLAKYQAVRLDVIVAVGPAALNFALAARRDLWQSVPVVFAGGDENTAATAAAAGSVTGSTLRVEAGKTLALARALLPGARHLVLVGQRDVKENYFLGFDKVLEEARRDYTVIDLRDLPMAQLLERVAVLPPDSIVHFTTLAVDSASSRATRSRRSPRVRARRSLPTSTPTWARARSAAR
jgi:hypothetical protein